MPNGEDHYGLKVAQYRREHEERTTDEQKYRRGRSAMTFDEKRKELLGDFDKCALALRDILADRLFCNELHPPFKKAMSEFEWAVKHLIHLNGAENL